ncbi:hypothetical protein OIE63_10010 [Streptomyces sp. NBC_01795]|uniref:hypothetical protein n=1 Tax=unclassified Streptomyces TaxID=2593676 RepID=UPI002DDA7677|nr:MULTISPECIES: hypothetical protein [unclassified Streptomyces]WSA91859.1 hypothetical protein OIE63_10010 [Streptomyces sp. NBC_01795]WSB76229.1 hypothetical protein OHB04_10815 [Streptomyces sp. NBC_01775]
MRVRLLRAVGVATAAYGLAVTARPELLARPSGLVDEEGRTAPDTRTSLRPLAWRDAASGLALALAPEGPALRTAAWLRLAADFGDAALLAATLPRPARSRAVALSVAWGAVSVAGLYGSGRCERGPRRGLNSDGPQQASMMRQRSVS